MITYLPTIFVVLVALAGFVARYSKWDRFPKRAETAALGGYATGLLAAWLVASFLRGIIAISLGASAHWYHPITELIPFFFVESMVIAIALGNQFRFLDGEYEADSEWKASLNDGVRFAVRFVIVASLVFVPIWWLLAPGEYGMFKGSIADALVPNSVDSIYSVSEPTTELETIRRIQQQAAIPHAVALAALIAPLFFGFMPLLRLMRKELNRDMAHVQVERRPQPRRPFLRIFNPRGGERN